MSDCVNHPGVPATGICARCGQPFCDSCLVEFLGARYCGPCRNLRLAETQGFQSTQQSPVFAGTGNVDIGRWLSAGWQMVSADLGMWMLATLLFILLGLLTCGLGFAALECGLYLIAFRKLSGRPASATDVSLGFRRFLNALGTGLLLYLPSIAVYSIEQVIGFAMQFTMQG